MDRSEFAGRASACAEQLYRVSWCILHNNTDCEDAVQEALFLAWKKLHTLRHPEYFETWLTRILINECRRMLRERISHTSVALDEALTAAAPETNDPDLQEALRRIDAKYSLPLILRHVSGYSTEEICRILKLPKTTVKWRMGEARRRLAKLLNADL